MPRKLRVEYPGAIYHVMSRGDQREDICLDDVDRHDFIKTLAAPRPDLYKANKILFSEPPGQQMNANVRRIVKASLWLTLGLLFVYLLSIGPTYRLMRIGTIPTSTFLSLYGPINKCCEHNKLFERILDDYYLELWYSDTRNQKRWLEQLGASQGRTVEESSSTNNTPRGGERP